MREKFQRFMSGRYGVDQLGKFCLYVTLALLILSLFFRNALLNILVFVMLIILYLRMFSRNFAKRSHENDIYLNYKNKVVSVFNKQKYMANQRKTYHIYTCPNCKQKIRVPKGKGKIAITCPKCTTEFIKKS